MTDPIYDQAEEAGLDDVSTMQLVDINTWLVGDILVKADRMTMAHSLELRVPFLDREVMTVAAAAGPGGEDRRRDHQGGAARGHERGAAARRRAAREARLPGPDRPLAEAATPTASPSSCCTRRRPTSG